jgi:uncharacterized protein
MTKNDRYISWSQYHQTIKRLAINIYHSQWHFDCILCLARGGLRIGDLLSRMYDKPLAILSVSSYGGADDRLRGKIKFSEHLTATNPLEGRVLLVDDLVDSGLSLHETLLWLQARYSGQIEEVRTAVLWYKACSMFVPDYYVEYLADNPWIYPPFAEYEHMDLATLVDHYEPSPAICQF